MEVEIAEVVKLLDILGEVRLIRSRLDKRIWGIEDHGSFLCKSSFFVTVLGKLSPLSHQFGRQRLP